MIRLLVKAYDHYAQKVIAPSCLFMCPKVRLLARRLNISTYCHITPLTSRLLAPKCPLARGGTRIANTVHAMPTLPNYRNRQLGGLRAEYL
jgi:hypothetical protein